MRGYGAFGVHRTESLQGRPQRMEGSEDRTAWRASWGRTHLLLQPTPLSAGPRRESGSEPAGGAASPPRELQGRGGGRQALCFRSPGEACRRVLISWDFFLQQLNGSTCGGLGFLPPGPSAAAAAQLLGSRVFKPRHRGPRLPAAVLNSSGLRGHGARGCAWYRGC